MRHMEGDQWAKPRQSNQGKVGALQPLDETHRICWPKENDEEPLPQGGLRRLSNTHPSLRCLFFKVGPGCLAEVQGKCGVRLTEVFKTSALTQRQKAGQGRDRKSNEFPQDTSLRQQCFTRRKARQTRFPPFPPRSAIRNPRSIYVSARESCPHCVDANPRHSCSQGAAVRWKLPSKFRIAGLGKNCIPEASSFQTPAWWQWLTNSICYHWLI